MSPRDRHIFLPVYCGFPDLYCWPQCGLLGLVLVSLSFNLQYHVLFNVTLPRFVGKLTSGSS